VPRFRIDKLAELARQLEFTPHETRLAQVNAAEALLHDIDSDKAYPVEFVVYRITNYHPRGMSRELLAGAALQHDLGLLIEHVSDSLRLRTDQLAEPVLSIDEVTERFNVTSKTIQRWRRRGLPARRFTFPDGRRRVGFLVGSVERFFAEHREQVSRGTNFSQIDEAERQEILRRARRLAGPCGCCGNEIARRIARKLNRSELTILHIIRKHDQEQPGQAILGSAAESLTPGERQRIARAFKRGVPLSGLARRICRPRAMIYRAIIEERIEQLSRRKVRFFDDPLYHQEDAASVLDHVASQEELSPVAISPEESRVPRDLPLYLQELYRTPLLTPARERALFLKLNYHKYKFVSARRQLDPQLARMRHLDQLESALGSATETKNEILRANLRLVVSIARKHLRPGLSLMELISDGNLTLMRAVDGFDVHRGNKFSTYATLALMKGFARSVPQMLRGNRAVAIEEGMLETLPDRRDRHPHDPLADREQVRVLLSRLSDRERRVLVAQYGLEKSSSRAAQQLGLTRHRMRQIEKLAIAKLRRTAFDN
jgi:RNA polymerase sigma factor (sigma-70 family)